METLLESLAVLGKLGTALDTIAQRLPSELFTLVESTLDEVEERAEFGKRQSLTTSLDAGLSKFQGVYVFRLDDGASINDLRPGKTQLKASVLRLSALESLTMRAEHEILRDLFWTLYSKLDAVAQGLRVVTEVSNRIGSVRRFLYSCHQILTDRDLAQRLQRFVWSEAWHTLPTSRSLEPCAN